MKNDNLITMFSLDSFDLKILRLLQDNNLLTQKDIGERVNLSPAAVQRRIKRIQGSGIIKANCAIVDPKIYDGSMTIIVEIILDNEKENVLENLKEIFNCHEEVQQCYYVAGAADFILVLSVTSIDRYEKFTKEIFFNNTSIKKFNTFVVLDCVKAGLKIKI